jgi:FlaG/FlaF family flagellin (archaellin)
MTRELRGDDRGISPVYALAGMAVLAVVITIVVGLFVFGIV